MADDPQAQDALIPVRYVGGQPRIINGETVADGDVVYLPADEVDAWPQDGPHPYYARVSDAEAQALMSSAPKG